MRLARVQRTRSTRVKRLRPSASRSGLGAQGWPSVTNDRSRRKNSHLHRVPLAPHRRCRRASIDHQHYSPSRGRATRHADVNRITIVCVLASAHSASGKQLLNGVSDHEPLCNPGQAHMHLSRSRHQRNAPVVARRCALTTRLRRVESMNSSLPRSRIRSAASADSTRSSSCSSAPLVARSSSPLTAITVARPSRRTSTRNWLCTRSKAKPACRRASLTRLIRGPSHVISSVTKRFRGRITNACRCSRVLRGRPVREAETAARVSREVPVEGSPPRRAAANLNPGRGLEIVAVGDP